METEEGSPTIDGLPSEILVPILNSLPYKDRLNVTSVSTRWHKIIDERLGRKLFVGRPCQFTPADEERYRHHYVPIEAIQTVGANTCYFGEVVDPTNSMSSLSYWLIKVRESLFGSKLPTFKHPHLVQNLFFDGPIPSNYFEAIIQPVKSLKRLDLHLSALSCLSQENMEFTHLSRLETLNIWGHRLTQGMFTQFYNSRPITRNLIEIWDKNHFPHLTKLSMEYPFDLKEELQVTEKLLEFLKRHKNTLEAFRLCVNLFITSDSEFSDFELQSDRTWITQAKTISRLLHIKHVEVMVTSLFRVLLHRIWVGFVESQGAMETVTIATFRLQSDILERICEKNFRTLTKLTLTRLIFSENDVFRSASFSPLRNCTKLTSLFLEGMMHGGGAASMTGAQNLPQSLQTIDIGGIILTSEDVHYMLTRLTELEQIFLTGVGHADTFGVTINTLREVIAARRLRKVSLYGSLNGGIPDGGFPNGNPSAPTAIVGRSYGTLEIVLDDDGYYKDLPRPPIIDPFTNLDLEEFEGR